jgi:iron complex outermembrane recepter protein
MRKSLYTAVLLATSAIGATSSLPAVAQQGASQATASGLILEEVVVTARRREENLQDVPISMTVFQQQQLDNANITNSGELASYVPSLQINPRFGGDTTTFAIRGFSQELRTTASVGVYFAEVVAPRGANSSVSGDGAGPGDYFDLQNVQVLKGPQGTLFGRNTTGGAILLTPQKPTDQLEGYLEASAGNYDMWRTQGVINVPAGDRVRLRFGVDHQEREGYLDNISGIGPDDFANVEYTALRASAVIDFTDNLENYTIIKYADSDNNGYPGSIFYCNTAEPLGSTFCQPDLDRRKAAGQNGFYDVYSFVPNPKSAQETWQAINTTTWHVNDNFTVKNIISYANLQTEMRSAIYGTNWIYNFTPVPQPVLFQMVGLNSSRPTTDQKTVVEELQFSGLALDGDLVWQTGLYYEKSEPEDDYGSQSPALISCDLSTVSSPNPEDFRCNNLLRQGSIGDAPGGATYENKAVYLQATYDINDQFATTAGIRYTDDKTEGEVTENIYFFPTVREGGYVPYDRMTTDVRKPKTSSDKPTWLLGLDYKPNDDQLYYAKYALGYRQGSVNIAGTPGLDSHGPEEVDSYEIGAKFTVSGRMAGFFNVAAFYNDFQDQQIQYGYFAPSGVGTTAIVNAGSSTIWGIEIENSLQLTERINLSASYTYLNTNVDEVKFPTLPPDTPLGFDDLNTSTAEDEDLSYSPENKLVVTASYLLPFDQQLGDMTVAATYVYTDEMQAASKETSIYATLPDYHLVNLNFNWNGMFGSPVDMSVFGTNVTDEEYITFLTGNWNNGLESGQVGQPRMYGVRFKYNFGDY